MEIKKIGPKPFHLGNKLNGDGSKVRAKYGVFKNGEKIGFVVFNGSLWDAYHNNGTRLNPFGCAKLATLKELLKGS